MNEEALSILGQYLDDLKSNQPVYNYSDNKNFTEWSSMKSAVEIIIERMNERNNPVNVVQDMAIQSDYFATISYDNGHLEAYEMFSIWSDVAIDIMDLFYDKGIKEETW